MSPIGTVVPEDRRVLITPTISTVIQFRTIDWGMDDCRLHISVPALGGADAPFSLALYRLNQTHPLDASRPCPQRVAKIEDIDISRGQDTMWQRGFACQSDEVLTFELACSSISQGGCLLEWWQKRGVDPGQ
ncbi:hypothetical protein DFH07DRAFT_744342 [Mycena maculata]|uniref:Ubiquitin 3 binding protein But2 C-terminal domain-containing protein n=1 Tax=Mycena maculata TaxID=230809 RepID=A0AAD7J179_9AGAR|nr:hypothetical protein DFH07DRAFT_744342 [Mycena maculata]